MQKKLNAKAVLKYLIETLTVSLEELSEHDDDFALGEKYAYVECLEIIQSWYYAEKFGVAGDIESKYPLK